MLETLMHECTVEAQVKILWKMADRNNDGVLSRMELAQMFKAFEIEKEKQRELVRFITKTQVFVY